MRKFIGYETLINNFKDRCMNNTLSHAHLIAGEDGIGKSNLANILAKLILNGELDREYVDIINYSSSKASFGVDDVRNIIEEVSKKPFEGEKKVIIIHEGNKLTIQAQNALLKTIEEPPIGVHIIILCESLELILDTIKSRCEIYKLTPLTKEELYEYIRIKKLYFNDNNLKELRSKIIELIRDLNKNNVEIILQHEENFIGLKDNKEEVLNILGGFIRDILIHKEVENKNFIINGDKIDDINELTKEMSFRKLNNMIMTIEEARRNIKSNVSWAMTLRVMLMGFMEG